MLKMKSFLPKLKYKKILFFGFISSFILFTNYPIPIVYAGRAEILSDEELDAVHVGGFDFDLNAAYAFRSAVVNQLNIAGVSTLDNTGSLNIAATNKALVLNEGNSAVTNQLNLNAVVAKSGDIVNAEIENLNVAQVVNNYIAKLDAAAAAEPETGVQASNLALTAIPEAIDAITSDASESAISATPLSSDSFEPQSPATPAQEQTQAPESAALVPSVTGAINAVTASASAVAAQTNIAAMIAMDGGISNSKINNTNIACVENQGNAALAAQTNIAIAIAKYDIKESIINNLNIADVINKNTTNIGGAIVNSVSLAGVLMNIEINNVIAENSAVASQANITFIKSLTGEIKNNIIKELNSSRVFNF